MRSRVLQVTFLIAFPAVVPAVAQEEGRDLYMQRCFWCHGEAGDGNGLSTAGMLPRPRDFTRPEYKIRSTRWAQLPTDEDLFRVVSRGLPDTPMQGWERILSQQDIRQLVSYVKSFSPRFANETPVLLPPPPQGEGSVERGRNVYRKARCFMCHGDAGRGDGGITTTLGFQWGFPFVARDLTRGWTFKGGHEPREIYLRITGGLNGTPMESYRELLSSEERWDLAHYVASLDQEPAETSADFVIEAIHVRGELPDSWDAAPWAEARKVVVPLAGQIMLDPPTRWWTPTVRSASVRALWSDGNVAFLLEWNDPTGPGDPMGDSAFLQIARLEAGKPYFLLGDPNSPVGVWQWHSGGSLEEWKASGVRRIEAESVSFHAGASWEEGRWHVIFQRALTGEPSFEPGRFVPLLVSIRDGANGEADDLRAISTWLYATLRPPRSARPWLLALAFALGTVVVEVWVLSRLRR